MPGAPINSDGLSPQIMAYERFAKEYVIDYDMQRAAKAAGFSDHYGSCWRMIRRPLLRSLIEKEQARICKKLNITAERIAEELALLGFANMADYILPNEDGTFTVDFSELTREQAAAIGEVTSEVYTEGRGEEAERVKRVKFKLADKKGALDSLARHLGMFNDKQTVSGTVVVEWAKKPE